MIIMFNWDSLLTGYSPNALIADMSDSNIPPGIGVDRAVSIKCRGAVDVRLEDLKEFQGNLKDLSHENYQKLRTEILTHGFSEPVSIWINNGVTHVINGHQRLRVLQGLMGEGFFIPPIPASVIEAKDEREAKEKVLALTSQFGEITEFGLYEFMEKASLDYSILDNFRFPEIDIEKWKQGYELENKSEELDLTAFDNFNHQCPKCGFEWDDNAKDGNTPADGTVES